ncbi:MAG: PAS-domain containing protein [Alphaproteobacteria bacterium]|nr:PAS-domain containing protein [Alphaproteobacteria bacterium]
MSNTIKPISPPDMQPSLPPAADIPSEPKVVFGIKTKLSLAFLALAALTMIASAVAWLVFTQIEKAVTVITEHTIPEITLALGMAEISADITASAPTIVASTTQSERAERREQLDKAEEDLGALISQWETRGIAQDVAYGLSAAATGIAERIGIADEATEIQLTLAAHLDRQSATLDSAHAQFLEILEPLIDDVVFDLVIKSETGNQDAAQTLKQTVERGTARLDRLTALKADANLLVGLLRESTRHGDEAPNEPFEAALESAHDDLNADLGALADSEASPALQQSVRAVLGFVHSVPTEPPSLDNTAQRLAALTEAHDGFLRLIETAINSAKDRLLAETQLITDRQASTMTDLVDTGSLTLLHLLSLRADGNLAAGILREAVNVSAAARLAPLSERFDAAAGRMDRALRQIPRTLDLTRLRSVIGQQLGLGRDQENMFNLKRSQLEQLETAELALDEIRTRSVALGAAVTELVQVAESMSDSTAANAQRTIDNSKIVMVLLFAASILCAFLLMVVFVGPRLIRPIEEITRAMARLAAGDTQVDIPGSGRQDELGRMAHALGVFRDITIEVQESNLREIETARRRLSDAIESISEAFSLYDREDRLVVCNRKYGTLVHPEIADEIKPGLTFEQIVRRALEAGFIDEAQGREEEWLVERIARHRNPGAPHLMQRTDGVWIMVSERQTAEGGIVAVYSDITELKERENELAEKSKALEQLSGQLSKYLSPQVYQSIFTGQQAATVASQRKKLTVFFSDLEGFTETADRLESEDLAQLLNEYLTEMSKIALDHGATIDKYVGDSIMIFFGDPVSNGIREDALACVRMAIAMQKRLGELSAAWADHGLTEELKCRIGIATGFCTVGNFGSEDRMDYTIIGGSVNLASRLENAAAPGSILISGETHTLVHKDIACREHETVKIKGLAYPVKTYLVAETDGQETPNRISERRGKLAVDLDLDAMTDQEREQAAGLLREVMNKLHGPGERS